MKNAHATPWAFTALSLSARTARRLALARADGMGSESGAGFAGVRIAALTLANAQSLEPASPAFASQR